ncbi:uncharacterized protein LOC124661969 [Lolium rigidum]|uniref:uncharacterized protein LOC124661969 n=1 Tax=Lolium rigidum TaxID=89674 RepID=UPI001F5DCBD5|nr:uncharacterized protein LOC124661969 [Lolium rigidum]
MASIVLLLSELLGGAGSTSMLAANCYVSGHSLREFRPAPVAAAAAAKGQRAPPATGAKQGAAAGEAKEEESSFEDLAAISRIAVDVMWP